MEEQKKKRQEAKKERGSKDDWEALAIIMDEMPSLKQRVLHKIREIKRDRKNKEKGVSVSKRDLQKSKLENKKK